MLSKISLDFSSVQIDYYYINLKYTFNIPFRITLKTIIMGTSSQFHDGAQLKFYPHFSSKILHFNVGLKKCVKVWELPFKQ